MNDLLFYALIAVLLFYFFIYLPNKKQLPIKLTQEQATQTNPELLEKQELEPILDQLIKNIQQLNKQIK